jgi:hypothetical protein
LLLAAGHPRALEHAAEPHVNVEIAGVLVKVKKSTRAPREVTALAFLQLGELA